MVWNEKQMVLPQDAPGWISGPREWGQSGDTAVCHGFLPVVTSAGKGWRRCPSQQGAAARPVIWGLSQLCWLLCSGFIHSLLE